MASVFTPHLAEIMDVAAFPSVRDIDICKAPQSSPEIKDRAMYGLSESPPLKQCISVPEKVQELADILKRVPVAIYVSPERVSLRHPQSWGNKNWDLLKKISNLVFMTPDVFDFICGHQEKVINGRNII